MITLVFKSYKARRITTSATSAVLTAFSDMGDVAVTLVHELETLLEVHIPVKLLIDNQSLFDVISKGTSTS